MAFNLKQFLGSVAPTLAAAIGGPFAGMAVQAIGGALGLDAPTQEKIEQVIAGSKPEDLLKLKVADQEFAKAMKQLDVDVFKIEMDDRASARQRETQVKDLTPSILAYILIAGTGLAIGATLMGITKVDSALAGTLIGYLVAECRSALAYFFGTTAQSRAKDVTLADIAKAP